MLLWQNYLTNSKTLGAQFTQVKLSRAIWDCKSPNNEALMAKTSLTWDYHTLPCPWVHFSSHQALILLYWCCSCPCSLLALTGAHWAVGGACYCQHMALPTLVRYCATLGRYHLCGGHPWLLACSVMEQSCCCCFLTERS